MSQPIRRWPPGSRTCPHPRVVFEPGKEARPPAYVRVFRTSGVAEAILGFGGRWVTNSLLYASLSDVGGSADHFDPVNSSKKMRYIVIQESHAVIWLAAHPKQLA